MGTLTGPWTTSTTYKPDGSLATQTLPAAGSVPAETITYGYDNTGRPLSMAGLDTYIADTTYDVRGNPVGRTLGTGTKRVQLDTIFDIFTNRLAETRVSTENQTTPSTWVPQLIEQYGYDDAGNVKNIKEVNVSGTTVSNQCFSYDALRRLTEAWTTTAATCQATPSQAIVGGPDPYWTSYQYNSIGNRTNDTVHTAGGNTVRTYAYPASGATSVRPHAITNVTAAGLNPGTDSYGYDQAGNTTTRSIAGKPGQTLTWDPEGHLASVTDSGGTTSYVYTPDGQRLLAYEPGSVTTLYLGDYELRRTTTGIICTRHYGVAARTTGGGLTWIAADHHGTGQVAINPTTLAVTRRKSDPFGNVRGPAAAWPTTRAFVDGIQDATGLTHLGAREYEPAAGRFISVDPIMDLAEPAQWNGYTYANSNPVTLSDPDGLDPCPGGGGGCHYDGTDPDSKFPNGNKVTAEQMADGLHQSEQAVEKMKGDKRRKADADSTAKRLYGRNYDELPDWDRQTVDRYIYCEYDPIMCKVEACIPGSSTVPCSPELLEYSEANPAAPLSTEEVVVIVAVAVVGLALGARVPGPKPVRTTPVPKRVPARGGTCATFNSFDPDTLVLMADGTTKPIKNIKVGDVVVATDPETGRTEAKLVATLHRNLDHYLTDITIALADGTATVLHTTAEHPFWNATQQEWTNASQLSPGELLRSSTGGPARVTAVRTFVRAAAMYNLTIHDIHTYYVLAGDVPILVHNDSTPWGQPGHSNYVLIDKATNKVYYSGRFGPNESAASVIARHTKSGRIRPGLDRIEVIPGTRTYAAARLMEDDLAAMYGTRTGGRGNVVWPMQQKKRAAYANYVSTC